MPPYERSIALEEWFATRRADLRVIEEAHRAVSQLTPGPGRPRMRGGAHLGQAFILRVYAEFQGFIRDLHGLSAEALVRSSGVAPTARPRLIAAATVGRAIDQGNANLNAVKQDFRRLGMSSLGPDLAALNTAHGRDQAVYERLTSLRNAIAHGNSDQLERLDLQGVRATLTYGRSVLPSLNRLARALDRAVWNHLRREFPNTNPWG